MNALNNLLEMILGGLMKLERDVFLADKVGTTCIALYGDTLYAYEVSKGTWVVSKSSYNV